MGRLREFDIEKAVETAMDLFWRNGYDKTSLTDLTQALKITPSSFYFAFGSKERLFKKVLERYFSNEFGFFDKALRQPTSLGVATSMLKGLVDMYTDPAHPGCLCINSTSPCFQKNDPIRNDIAKWQSALSVKLRKRFKEAKTQKDLPLNADSENLANYTLIVASGMALAAQSGARRKDLQKIAATALEVWPR